MKTKEAVDHLRNVLESDDSFRMTWAANIAIQFQDEWQRAVDKGGLPATPVQIHEISNKAADNFLNLLCRD